MSDTPAPAPEIRVLPRVLVDQIAAGEVVERPASVVRELLDNAIDAGARNIEITLEGGGRQKMKISDDGTGIRLAGLPLAFASHATSKLQTLEDLQQIATLGFRGEALASIGAVSRARIRSFAHGEPHAGEITNEGGLISAVAPAARCRGTDVEISDLFYNVPARRRFLRRDSTETGHAVDIALRHALVHLEIAFKIMVDGRTAHDFPASGILQTNGEISAARMKRIARVFGPAAAADLMPFSVRSRSLQIEGLVGGAASARPDASGIHLFLNGRFIKDRGALHVVRQATRDFLGARQPLAFLFISIEPSQVDVNVHPAKLEVRFREPSAVYGPLHQAISRLYSEQRPAADPTAMLDAAAARPLDSAAHTGPESTTSKAPWVVYESPAPSAGAHATDAPRARDAQTTFVAPDDTTTLVPRGARFLRAFDTFLVLESSMGIEIVDQHALHERIQFEDLRARVRAGGKRSQNLLIPEPVAISAGDAALVEEFSALWADAGFEVSLGGPATALIRAVPSGLKRVTPAELFQSLLSDARENRTKTADQMIEEVLHRCACHASVRAGDRLSDGEIEYLLQRGAGLPSDQTCPHGRPTRIRITLRDLERAFERK